MKREMLLEKLHECKVGVYATVMPTEGAIECEFVNSRGFCADWVGMWDWPVYHINISQEEKGIRILDKINSRNLTEEDIKNTELGGFVSFAHEAYSIEMRDIINQIYELDFNDSQTIYVIDDNGDFSFYTEYGSLIIAFEDYFMSCVTLWEELDDCWLEEWVERIEADEPGILTTGFDQ